MRPFFACLTSLLAFLMLSSWPIAPGQAQAKPAPPGGPPPAAPYRMRTLYTITRPDEQRFDSGFVRLGSYYRVSNVRLTALRPHGYAAQLMARLNRILQYSFVADSLNSLPYSSQPAAATGNLKEVPLWDGEPMHAHRSYIKEVTLLVTPRHDSLLNVVKGIYEEGQREPAREAEYQFVLRAGRVRQLPSVLCPDPTREGQSLERRVLRAAGPHLSATARRKLHVPCAPKNLVVKHLTFESNGLRVMYHVCLPGYGEKFRCAEDDVNEDRENIIGALLPYQKLAPALFAFAFPQIPCPFLSPAK